MRIYVDDDKREPSSDWFANEDELEEQALAHAIVTREVADVRLGD